MSPFLSRFARCASFTFLLAAVSALPAVAQNQAVSTGHQKRASRELPRSTILIQSDADCTFLVDDQQAGEFLNAGATKKVSASLGEHLLTAVSLDGKDHWRAVVSLEKPEQKVVLIELGKVRESRLASERQAEQLEGQRSIREQQAQQAQVVGVQSAQQREVVQKQRKEIQDQIELLEKQAEQEDTAANNDEAAVRQGQQQAAAATGYGTKIGTTLAGLNTGMAKVADDSAKQHRAKAQQLRSQIAILERKLQWLSHDEISTLGAATNRTMPMATSPNLVPSISTPSQPPEKAESNANTRTFTVDHMMAVGGKSAKGGLLMIARNGITYRNEKKPEANFYYPFAEIAKIDFDPKQGWLRRGLVDIVTTRTFVDTGVLGSGATLTIWYEFRFESSDPKSRALALANALTQAVFQSQQHADLLGDSSHSVQEEIASIRSAPHDEMPSAEMVPASLGSGTVMNIQNETAYVLTVLLSGPVIQRVEVNPGLIKALEIPPGQYEIAAKVSNASVIPFYGTQTYASDAQYSEHFYLSAH